MQAFNDLQSPDKLLLPTPTSPCSSCCIFIAFIGSLKNDYLENDQDLATVSVLL